MRVSHCQTVLTVPDKEQQLYEGRFVRRYRSCPNDRVHAPRHRWRVPDRDRRISIKSGKDAVGRRVNQPAEDIGESLSPSGGSSYYDGRFKENLPCEALLL